MTISNISKTKIRVTADVPLYVVEQLRVLAVKKEIGLTEAMCKAIGTEGYILEAQSRGARIIIEEFDGSRTKVFFK